MKSKNWLAATGFAFLAVTSFAQKAVETSAAVEFKNNYQDKFMRQDFDAAKKSLLKAKGFVDQAAAHADTKESPKTLWLKGEIYSNFFILGLSTMDTNFMKEAGEDGLETAIASYKKGYEVSDKFDEQIRDAVGEKKMFIENFAVLAYNNKMYKEAREMYDMEVKFSDALGMVDSLSIYYAGICSEKAGEWDKAADYYKKCAEINYKVPEIYKNISVALINAGKNEEATEFLQKAVAKFPNDEYLFFYIGSMYIDMKDEAKATENLKRAVEINPKFNEAQYQLGKHYLDIATRLRDEAGQLPPSQNSKADKLMAESLDYYGRAAGPLETYIAAVPNDKAVLICLFQIHRALDHDDKAAEYKKRADAL